ncbi:MAG: serine/threonine protein kinase, partial [Thiothrix litoralis]
MDIPNYAIERELGKGGMATVYLARQVLLNRQVALKVMSPEFSTGKTFQEAFLQEGKVVAQLEHPNIVKIYDIGIHDSTFYMAMEYLSGGSLRDRLKTETFTPAAVLQMLRQLGAGLAYAHEQGFIHRDIKPENILFRKDGTAVLTDFGIAKVQDSIGEMTRMGYTTGTAQYMSPEQASAGRLDYRSDLYSLGLVVFEMLSGERVCKADSFAQAVYQHTIQPTPTLPVVYRVFQPVMQKVLAKQPEQRYRNVEAFVEAFAAVFLSLQGKQQTTALAAGGDTAIFIPEQPADTFIFDPKPEPVLPSLLPAAQRAAETSPVLVIREAIPWWKKPLFLTSLVGGIVAGLLALLFLPLLKSEPAAMLPETPIMPASPPVLATPSPPADKPPPVNPVSVPSGRQEPGMKGRQFKVQTTDDSLLILRSKPRRDSTEVAKLPVGTVVSVQGNTVYDETIAGKKGRWLSVSALSNKGYVFDVHLKAVDAPPTGTNSASLKPYVIRTNAAKLYPQPTIE